MPVANAPKLTKNQTLVFSALSTSGQPLSAYTLLDHLRDDGFRAPLQVYRALHKLIDYGMVHKLESINSFVACAHPHEHSDGQVAFAICDQCRQIEEFSDPTITQRLRDWSAEHQFKRGQCIIELRGTCAKCQSN